MITEFIIKSNKSKIDSCVTTQLFYFIIQRSSLRDNSIVTGLHSRSPPTDPSTYLHWIYDYRSCQMKSAFTSDHTVPREYVKTSSGSVITTAKSVASGASLWKRYNPLVEERNQATSRRSWTIIGIATTTPISLQNVSPSGRITFLAKYTQTTFHCTVTSDNLQPEQL